MRMRVFQLPLPLCGLMIAVLLVSGCAIREPRPEGAWLQDRERWFHKHPDWTVQGRLGLSNGQRGGSLSFDWQAQGDQHTVQLRTIAGGKQWRLQFGPEYALLEGSDIDRLEGSDPDPLVEQAVGWPIPVQWLSQWLRGLPAPAEARMAFAEDGTLTQLRHSSWSIDFSRWTDGRNGVLLPTRIEARDPPHRVRAAMSNWRFKTELD